MSLQITDRAPTVSSAVRVYSPKSILSCWFEPGLAAGIVCHIKEVINYYLVLAVQ